MKDYKSLDDLSDEEIMILDQGTVKKSLDDLSDEEIMILDQGARGNEKTLSTGFKEGAKSLGRGFLKAADLVATPVRAGLNFVAGEERFKPVSEEEHVSKSLKRHKYEGDGKKDEMITAGLEAVGGLPVDLAGGRFLGAAVKGLGMKSAGKALSEGSKLTGENIKLGASGAFGSGAASEAVDEDNPYGRLAAGLAGGIAGAGAVSAKDMFYKGKLSSIDKELLNKHKDLGYDPTLIDVMHDKQKAAKMAQKVRGTQDNAAQELKDRTLKEHLNKFHDADMDRSSAGNLAVEGAKRSVKAAREKSNKEYRDLYDALDESVFLHPYDTSTGKRPTRVGVKLHNVGEMLDDTDLLELGSKTTKKKAEMLLQLEEKGKLDFKTAHKLRSDIGKKAFSGTDEGKELRPLYYALGKDLESSAEDALQRLPGDKRDIFSEAQKNYRQHKENVIKPLEKIIEQNTYQGKSGSELLPKIIEDVKHDAKKLSALQQGLNDEELKSFNSFIIDSLGRTADGFSRQKFATSYAKLNKGAQSKILSHLSKKEKDHFLTALDIGKSDKAIGREFNPSGTASHLDKNLREYESRSLVGHGINAALSGDPTLLLGKIATYATKSLLDKKQKSLYTNPDSFKKILASKDKNFGHQSPVGISAVTRSPFDDFLDNIKKRKEQHSVREGN